jgi:lipopolysaccharide export system permease protein
MTRVDRYLLFLYLRVLIICFSCLVGLLVVIHAFTNLDELIAFGKARRSVARGLLEYYGPYSLVILDRFGGMLALLAVMFVVSWLKRTNELVALMAAGISPRRILAVPLLASLVLFIATTVNRETIIPQFEEMLGKNPQDLSAEHLRPVKPVFDARYGILVGGRLLSLAAQEIKQPVLRLEGPAAVVGRQIHAQSGRYLPADEHHPAGLLLEGITVPEELTQLPSVYHQRQPVLLLGSDQEWLQADEAFLPLSIDFDELLGGSSWMQYASTLTLIHRLRSPSSHVSNELRLCVHQRFVQPLLDVTLLLLGIPILLRQQERHLFWIAGATLTTVGVFVLATKLIHGMASGATSLPPYLGAWLPLLIFAPIAYARAQQALSR